MNITRSKERVKSSGEVFTPIALCQELVQKIIDQGISNEKDWLVIANLEILFVVRALFVYNGWSLDKLHYASTTDRKLKFAKCLLGNENVSKYEYSKLKEWDPGMKFDVVLSNPPYIQGLHMKFLEMAFNQTNSDGHILFVHPSTCFINIKQTKQAHQKIVDLVASSIVDLTLINGNAYFNAGFFVPCCVTFLKKGYNNDGKIVVTTMDGKTHIFDDMKSVNQFGNIPELFSLIGKSQQYPNIWDNRTLVPQDKKYFVSFTGIRGNKSDFKTEMFNKDFWTIVGNHIGVTEEFNKDKLNWSFETPEEAFNFLNYLKTNFARRLLSFYKFNGKLDRGELAIIPWLDFTQEWTDKKLFAFFQLSQEEINFINLMPKYYE